MKERRCARCGLHVYVDDETWRYFGCGPTCNCPAKRYVEDGPPIKLPTREEMLAAELRFELHTESVQPNGETTPLIVRFQIAEARDRHRSDGKGRKVNR